MKEIYESSAQYMIMSRYVTQLLRGLRYQQTEAESIFWQIVRNRKLSNHKFYRQYPFKIKVNGNNRVLIADFYCHSAKLVIELDGGIHQVQQEYDKYRETLLKTLGLRIIRFSNEEILNNLHQVKQQLLGELRS